MIHQHLLRKHLQWCTRLPSLRTTKPLHACVITAGSCLRQPLFFYNNVMNLYLSLGDLTAGRGVFDRMPRRSVVSYNIIIGAYTRSGHTDNSWRLFSEMRMHGFSPTHYTLAALLSCDSLGPSGGRQLHGIITKNGLFHSDPFSATSLLSFYGRCQMLFEAFKVFGEMPSKNVVTWNSMISLAGGHGLTRESVLLFRRLLWSGLGFSQSSLVGVLTGFSSDQDLFIGEQVHGLATKSGMESELLVSNSLIDMYSKCSGVEVAGKIFDNSVVWDIVTFNTMITALGKSDRPTVGFNLFSEIFRLAIANQSTFVGAIGCCGAISVKWFGKVVHAGAIKTGFSSDTSVSTSLVGFYGKCDPYDVRESQLCFDEIENKNLVSWNALICGYSSSSSSSLFILKQMLGLGIRPNEVSFSTLVMWAPVPGLQQLHSLLIQSGYGRNEYLLSCLITSYARNNLLLDAFNFVSDFPSPVPAVPCNTLAALYNREGKYGEAQRALALMEEPDELSWNILILACTRVGDHLKAFGYLKAMRIWWNLADRYTFASLMRGCTETCNLVLGRSVHGLATKAVCVGPDTLLSNILVEMYGKCGSVEGSEKVFEEIAGKNMMSWTVLISALGMHGRGAEAVRKLGEMESRGVIPERVTFSAVLSACRHGGMVTEGMEVFEAMRDRHGVEPRHEEYECMVDLLARSGDLKGAERLILGMHIPPNASIWRSFLQGCDRAISSACG